MRRETWELGAKSYGAAGDTVKALLSLDVDVGAVGRLQLDIEGGYSIVSATETFHPIPMRQSLTLSSVVEVLVDKLRAGSAIVPPPIRPQHLLRFTHVVGALAQVTESRDGHRHGASDLLGELLGAAGLGDVGGERGGHGAEFVATEGIGGGGVRR